MNIGDEVRKARKKAKMTQNELAGHLNVTPIFISSIERNKRNPSIPTLQKIAEVTKTDLIIELKEEK